MATIKDTKIISVFGSHAPRPGSIDYEMAREVGRLLAEAGFAVSTGGYGGVMAAASRGAAAAGGHVIGVTSSQVESTRPARLNQWVVEEIRFETLLDRLTHLVQNNCGMIVLPGGIGTLSEFSLAWSFMQVGEMEPRPLILMGQMWAGTLDSFVLPAYVAKDHLAMIKQASSPAEAVDFLLAI